MLNLLTSLGAAIGCFAFIAIPLLLIKNHYMAKKETRELNNLQNNVNETNTIIKSINQNQL